MRSAGPQKGRRPKNDAFATTVCWILRADILPAAEDALLPIARGLGRRAPSDRIGRHGDDIVRHPHALIGSAQPVGLRRLTDEEKRRGYGRYDNVALITSNLPDWMAPRFNPDRASEFMRLTGRRPVLCASSPTSLMFWERLVLGAAGRLAQILEGGPLQEIVSRASHQGDGDNLGEKRRCSEQAGRAALTLGSRSASITTGISDHAP